MATHRPTERDRGRVEALVAYGIPQEQIARIVGITDRTLRKHYRAELDLGTAKAVARAADTLFRLALGLDAKGVATREPDKTCLIFFLKTRGRWAEARPVDDSGACVQTQRVEVIVRGADGDRATIGLADDPT